MQGTMKAAFEGHVQQLAGIVGVSDKRLYEILGRDDPYVKTWRLLKPLGETAPDRLRMIQADFNSRVSAILSPARQNPNSGRLFKVLADAEDDIFNKAPSENRKRKILEAIAELQKYLDIAE